MNAFPLQYPAIAPQFPFLIVSDENGTRMTRIEQIKADLIRVV